MSQDKIIAFAGITQAVALVHQLATTGKCDQSAFDASIHSLFVFDAETTYDVYGGREGVALGIREASDMLAQASASALTQYCLGVIQLQKLLQGDKQKMARIASQMSRISEQSLHFSETHENIIAALNELYTTEVSSAKFRIQVRGEPAFLQQQATAEKIRALLLAGIRSAHLWRQKGGSRLDLLLKRSSIQKALKALS